MASPPYAPERQAAAAKAVGSPVRTDNAEMTLDDTALHIESDAWSH